MCLWILVSTARGGGDTQQLSYRRLRCDYGGNATHGLCAMRRYWKTKVTTTAAAAAASRGAKREMGNPI